MRAWRLGLLWSGVAGMLCACAASGPPPGSLPEPAPLTAGAADTRDLLRQARSADIVLLGETHDNPAHHDLQKQVIESLRGDPRPSTLVMEQFDVGQQADIDAVLAAPLDIDARLDALGRLMPPGWSWLAYRPVVEAALRLNMPLRAANTPREALRPVMRQGLHTLDGGELDRLGLAAGWPGGMQRSLEKEIADGHCGLLPLTAISGMAAAQRVRDAVIADRLLAALPMRAVGIVGQGHARKDRGVPWYLAARSPQSKVLTVGLVDAANGGEAVSAFDYVIATPGVPRARDPCGDIPAPAAGRGR